MWRGMKILNFNLFEDDFFANCAKCANELLVNFTLELRRDQREVDRLEIQYGGRSDCLLLLSGDCAILKSMNEIE